MKSKKPTAKAPYLCDEKYRNALRAAERFAAIAEAARALLNAEWDGIPGVTTTQDRDIQRAAARLLKTADAAATAQQNLAEELAEWVTAHRPRQ